jgi:hypothetical protein
LACVQPSLLTNQKEAYVISSCLYCMCSIIIDECFLTVVEL